MRVRTLCCLLLFALVPGCGETKTVTKTVTVDATAKPGVAAPLENIQFGHIKSLTREGSDYELRFDPALFLSGETANVAAAEDGAVEPGEPVPNDNFVVDEGHRLLTYRMRADADVTVVGPGPKSVPISVEELARIVAGDQKPRWMPLESGFWLHSRIDQARSLDQQYRP